MLKFILKRLLVTIPVLLGVILIIFILMSLTEGDPALMMLGDMATPEEIEALRDELGLNNPFHIRYFSYVWDVIRGDLGVSYATREPVFEVVMSRLPATFRLSLFSCLFAILIGVPMGIISAVKQYSFTDNLTRVLALLGIAMPNFWLALMLVLFFSVALGWLPPSGLYGPAYYILPSISISAVSLATFARMTRSSMLEVIRQDYIRTARAKGQKESIIVFRHALHNALIPIIAVVGLQFAVVLGGAVVNEQIFAIPGIGNLMVSAIRARDFPVVQGAVLVIAVLFCLLNLFVDLLYSFVDPRIKSQYTKAGRKKKSVPVAAPAEVKEVQA